MTDDITPCGSGKLPAPDLRLASVILFLIYATIKDECVDTLVEQKVGIVDLIKQVCDLFWQRPLSVAAVTHLDLDCKADTCIHDIGEWKIFGVVGYDLTINQGGSHLFTETTDLGKNLAVIETDKTISC